MIAVIGSSNTDFTIRTDRFPLPGETVLGRDFFISGGGKGANQAAAIAKLGGEVSLISNIGLDHFGDERIRDLERFGVDTRFIRRDRLHNSGAAFILVDKSGRNQITVSPGSGSFLKLSDILKGIACVKRSRVVLLQLEVPVEAVRAAVYLAKKFEKLIILNPAPARKLSAEILSKVDILIPNEVELMMLAAGKASDTLGRARFLLRSGIGCVIITQGKKGALLVDRQGKRFFRAKEAKVVDTTCAGDAFCGAVALALDRGGSVDEAVEFANCAAALTVRKLGAQCSLPTQVEVRSLESSS